MAQFCGIYGHCGFRGEYCVRQSQLQARSLLGQVGFGSSHWWKSESDGSFMAGVHLVHKFSSVWTGPDTACPVCQAMLLG
jgi:hypothetical protein